MTHQDNPNSRLSVKITPDTYEALVLVAEREDVTITEALRRLVGYGALVYQTIAVDGHEVLTRVGRKQTVITLADPDPNGTV